MSDAPTTHDEWTAAQDEATVSVDGKDLTVAYYEAGEAPRGSDASGESGSDEDTDPPVVFLHGIPSWSFLWRGVAPALAEDRRVIAPDLLGYGNSDMRDGFDRSIRAQEAMLADLLDRLGHDTVDLVSHDIGAGAALRYAAHEPDAVERLVVSNGVCYDSWPVEFISDLGLPATADAPADEVLGRVRGAFAQGVYADEADEAFVEGMVAPWRREGGQTSLSRNAVATNTNHTTEIDYDAISADLLCLWGADDTFQPLSYGERLAEDVGGEVVELDRAYHWVVEDRTDAYVEELRSFLVE